MGEISRLSQKSNDAYTKLNAERSKTQQRMEKERATFSGLTGSRGSAAAFDELKTRVAQEEAYQNELEAKQVEEAGRATEQRTCSPAPKDTSVRMTEIAPAPAEKVDNRQNIQRSQGVTTWTEETKKGTVKATLITGKAVSVNPFGSSTEYRLTSNPFETGGANNPAIKAGNAILNSDDKLAAAKEQIKSLNALALEAHNNGDMETRDAAMAGKLVFGAMTRSANNADAVNGKPSGDAANKYIEDYLNIDKQKGFTADDIKTLQGTKKEVEYTSYATNMLKRYTKESINEGIHERKLQMHTRLDAKIVGAK